MCLRVERAHGTGGEVTTQEIVKKILDACDEINEHDVDHFVLIWHAVDNMPLAGVAPLNTTPIRTDMDVEKIPDLLTRMAKTIKEQKPWLREGK